MTDDRIYPAIVLNDYAYAKYAQWVKEGKKIIETREGRMFDFTGDIIICCGKSKSVGTNAGKAICIVNIWKVRPMKKEDEVAACIEWRGDRIAYLLKDWRYFNEDFMFSKYAIQKNFQGIFSIQLPENVYTIPQPHIIPYKEPENDLFPLNSFFS